MISDFIDLEYNNKDIRKKVDGEIGYIVCKSILKSPPCLTHEPFRKSLIINIAIKYEREGEFDIEAYKKAFPNSRRYIMMNDRLDGYDLFFIDDTPILSVNIKNNVENNGNSISMKTIYEINEPS